MAEAPAEVPLAVTWEMRLATAFPLPAWAVGALVAVLLLVVHLGSRMLAGVPFWESTATGEVTLTGSSRISIVLALLIGYTVAANRYLMVSNLRDLQELGLADPSLELGSRDPRVIGGALEMVRRSRLGGVVGLLAGACLLVLVGALAVGDSLYVLRGDVADTLFGVLVLLFFWLIGRSVWFTLYGTGRPADVARDLEVDLLDLRPQRVIGRMSLRFALLWIIGTSIGLPLFLTPGLTLGLSAPLVAVSVLTLSVAAAALLLPVRGVQQRVGHAKAVELARLDAELRRLRDTALEGDPGSQERLAGLLAYRRYVEDVREWPFDSSTFVRFSLYLLIPLFSWFGGALVERLLNTLLD